MQKDRKNEIKVVVTMFWLRIPDAFRLTTKDERQMIDKK